MRSHRRENSHRLQKTSDHPKPHHNGILSKGENQFVFVDTPGVLHSKNKLGDYMMKTVSSTLGGVDAAILVVDADYLPGRN